MIQRQEDNQERIEGNNICGLIGTFTTKKKHRKEALYYFSEILFCSQQRGTDATGYTYPLAGKKGYGLEILKSPVPAYKFLRTRAYKKINKDLPQLAIGHTRAKTQGDSVDNENNHPIFTKSGLALVHNGIINNDSYLTSEHKLKIDGKCDTEPMLKLIEKNYFKSGDMVRAIQETADEVRGTVAYLLINKREPRTIYAVSIDNPIATAWHKPTGTLYIASTKEILRDALVSVNRIFNWFLDPVNLHEFIFRDVPLETGLKITPFGVTNFIVEGWTATVNDYPKKYPADKPNFNSTLDDTLDGYDVNGEKKTEMEIAETIERDITGETGTTFDKKKPIKKPSKVESADLMIRLNHIIARVSLINAFSPVEERVIIAERNRILNALYTRKFFTKAQVKFYKKEAGVN